MKQVLFLCSANFYRSRFAEHLFNALAKQADLPWRANSRGLAVGHWGNIGEISHYTIERLKACGVVLSGQHRLPQPLSLTDLAEADLVIGVKEAEHRGMMAAQFPSWADRVEYWQVDDLDCATADEALPVLDQKVRELVERLRTQDEKTAA